MKDQNKHHHRADNRLKVFCIAFLIIGGAIAQASAQDSKIVARPLTPLNVTDFGLPSDTQTSGGLFNVGIGQPVYLEAQVPAGTVVTGVEWSILSQPEGSTAELTDSPLGSEVPIYNPGDREVNMVVGRKVIVPDALGHFMVSAMVSVEGGDPFQLIHNVTGATYVGVGTPGLHRPIQCAQCHTDKFETYKDTHHATAMTRKIDGIGVTHFTESCFKCHNVGYDKTPIADNGGFDDIARLTQWLAPETLEAGNWSAMPEELKNVANVQCENCHGPGSEHIQNLGDPSFITVNTSSGDCGQCHEAPPYHTKNFQWNQSRHAIATRYPTGENRAACVGCHSGIGFIDRIDGKAELRTDYEAIVCATCHDPHDATNPHQLRKVDGVTLVNGREITEGGNGRICMNCHIARGSGETVVAGTSSRVDPHHGPQTDMLAGENAFEYGRNIPSSAHLFAVQDTCVTCHMQELDNSNPAKNMAGEHTYKPVWDAGTPDDPSDDVDQVGACINCHGPIDSFDFPRQDFDGDGNLEGVQTEVEGLLTRVAMLLPPVGEPTIKVASDFTQAQRAATFNHNFVEEDGSHGIHNLSYTVNILKATLADLTGDGSIMGDSDNDRLPDDWERLHFGDDLAAQDADGDPDGDGLNNFFELTIMTNPSKSDSDGDGFSDFSELHVGTDPLNGDDNPTVGKSNIFHAAELVFFTEAGKTYQIQAVSELGTTGWTNVEDPIIGTGDAIQYFMSTRVTDQNFYRVIEVAQ